ncbi:MAG: hypothetical protein HYX47_07075 [Burkholderiales bacterium]|nr:hypothetical protein [Burkholderiales bacterium]
MGYFLQEHDIYVGSLLGELNVRFAPPQGKESHYGGIEEMIALQKEFKIFKKGRSFKTSVSVLNVGAFNNDVKNRWHRYLDNLKKHDSNKAGQNGDVAVVNALIKNLASKKPLPVYFTSHDMRGAKENSRVMITDKSRPVFYLNVDYLTISVPMQPESAAKASKAKK